MKQNEFSCKRSSIIEPVKIETVKIGPSSQTEK